MWFKLDDGFVTHPKILKAGPLALALQVRAISYASHHKTDGFLPLEAIPLFLVELGRSVKEWTECMVSHRLWDYKDAQYYVHDYLDWNASKAEIEMIQKQQKLGGKKGMERRWGKRSRRISRVITPVISEVISPVNNSLILSSSLNSLDSPEPKWFQLLRVNQLYAHVDFELELKKMARWKEEPKNKQRVLSHQFVVKWLNRIEAPLSNGHNNTLTCAHASHPKPITFPDLPAKEKHDRLHHPKYVG